MVRMFGILCVVFVGVAGMARPASADWLLSGFVGPIFNVKTSESDIALAENFDGSTGFGVNLASAFPARANLGFELDWAFYPKAMHTSDVIIDGSSEYFASKLMSISTNFFYSPAVSRFRPYFTVGPTFGYRSDHDDATAVIPSGWAVGINGGGGVIAFVNERFGGRVDFRYQRNFGDFYDIRPDAEGGRSNGWSDLRFFRLFFGGTVVL